MLTKILLNNFRNFEKTDFDFAEGITVIVGANGVGKTNILEAIFLLSTGKSFKARREEEVVNYSSDIARIEGIVESRLYIGNTEKNRKQEELQTQNTKYNIQNTNLEVVITRGTIDIGAERPERVPRKKLLVNGIPRHLYNFAGNLKTVLFGPWDLDLVTESPSIRRRFLDNVLSQIDREYRRSLLSYEKGLRQRNKLLLQIREEGIPRGSLMFWNQLLIKAGNYITDQRVKFIEFVNSKQSLKSTDYSLEYDKSEISEGRLEQYRDEEIASVTTLVGPHRDDFIFRILTDHKSPTTNHRELSKYGSRGEQRMGVLWLKMAELSFIEKISEVKPLLLLDDIFSELDHKHRDVVMEIVARQQTIITTAEEHFVEDLKANNIIKL